MRPSKTRVIYARSHVGVQIGAAVFNSLNLGKNGIQSMSPTTWGLHLVAKIGEKIREYIVPYANIQSMEIEVKED